MITFGNKSDTPAHIQTDRQTYTPRQYALFKENLTVKVNAKQKHLGCKKIARPRRSSIVNESATKSSDIR